MLENFVRRKEPSREDVVRDIGVLMTTKAQIDRELTRVKSQLDGLVEERKELIAEIQKTIDDVVAVRRAGGCHFNRTQTTGPSSTRGASAGGRRGCHRYSYWRTLLCGPVCEHVESSHRCCLSCHHF